MLAKSQVGNYELLQKEKVYQMESGLDKCHFRFRFHTWILYNTHFICSLTVREPYLQSSPSISQTLAIRSDNDKATER